jgi:hypothetical protein
MDILSRIQKHLLPHISRIFSATDILSQFRFVLLASFFAFFVFNIWLQFISPHNVISERMNLLSSPFASNNHILFGKQLYELGDVKDATTELLLAEQMTTLPKPFSKLVPAVLGVQSEPTDIMQTWEQNRTFTTRAYQYWKGVIGQKSDYRDAYITLTMLCIKLDKHDEAIMYLQKAHALDPNNTLVQVLAVQLEVLL